MLRATGNLCRDRSGCVGRSKPTLLDPAIRQSTAGTQSKALVCLEAKVQERGWRAETSVCSNKPKHLVVGSGLVLIVSCVLVPAMCAPPSLA